MKTPLCLLFAHIYLGLSIDTPIEAADEFAPDFLACDRSCRYVYGFYNRSVTGVRVDVLGRTNSFGFHCECAKDGRTISGWDLVDRKFQPKSWDPDTWSNDYSTTKLCVLRGNESTTVESINATWDSDSILHCGKCAACSDMHDLEVLYRTRDYITTNMTKCSTQFASPFSSTYEDLNELQDCLVENGIDFTTDGRAWGSGLENDEPTCMDCWTDNIMNDAIYCKTNVDCLKKFFDPTNDGAVAGCLECDEENSGPEFIRCAGANRRSTGIVSDIDRTDDEICTLGFYYSTLVQQ